MWIGKCAVHVGGGWRIAPLRFILEVIFKWLLEYPVFVLIFLYGLGEGLLKKSSSLYGHYPGGKGD